MIFFVLFLEERICMFLVKCVSGIRNGDNFSEAILPYFLVSRQTFQYAVIREYCIQYLK